MTNCGANDRFILLRRCFDAAALVCKYGRFRVLFFELPSG